MGNGGAVIAKHQWQIFVVGTDIVVSVSQYVRKTLEVEIT